MKVPEKYYDEIFTFKGQWDVVSRCGLRIIVPKGTGPQNTGREKTTVIATELYQDNPGTSITAAGKKLAEQICRDKGLDINEIAYIECNPNTNSKLSFYDEDFFEVDFNSGSQPVYRQLGKQEISRLSFPEGLE